MFRFLTVLPLFFSVNLLIAQEFDISLYKKTTLKDESQWRVITNMEYYKADVVFVTTRRNDLRLGTENIYYGFIELFGSIGNEDYGVVGPIGLPLFETGQYVTIYYTTLPERWEDNGAYIHHIDKVIFPAESFNFTSTHLVISNTNVISDSYTKNVLFTLYTGVEVQMLERESQQWAPILTADGFGGWVEYRYLEPISQSNRTMSNTSTNILENNEEIEQFSDSETGLEKESAQNTEVKRFPLWLFIGGGIFLLAVVGILIIVKKFGCKRYITS